MQEVTKQMFKVTTDVPNMMLFHINVSCSAPTAIYLTCRDTAVQPNPAFMLGKEGGSYIPGLHGNNLSTATILSLLLVGRDKMADGR